MNSKAKILAIATAAASFASSASALTIGYYDNTRELWGFDGNNYLSQAKQWLIDEGHTLVSTNYADAAFLSGVDAFYTGLIGTVDAVEIQAYENFVNIAGGFLFIQQDHDSGTWHAASQAILANWGIASSAGTFSNDTGHTTVGSSDWVTEPNLVTGFSGSLHSAVGTTPVGFETLATDDQGRIIMGVFDAGAGRSSDVLVATDIDFWSNGFGWTDARNRALWENIWKSVDVQVDPPPRGVPDSSSTVALLCAGLAALTLLQRKLR